MDPRRRRLLVSLVLGPAFAPGLPGSLGRAADASAAPTLLKVSSGTTGSELPLRYAESASPTILRVKRDALVRVALDNRLPDPTGLDLHGIRVSPPLGGSGPLGGSVTPGTTAEIAFTPPDSGTFWFHPWITDPKVDATGRGLAGLVLVEEPISPDVDADLVALLTDPQPILPTTADRDAAAQRVGGRGWPRIETLQPGSRVRLRLVNGSTRQVVAVTCGGARPSVVAVDGQPSSLFTPRGDTVPMGPGARFDLMFDMPRTPGMEVKLTVRGAEPNGASDVAMVLKAEGEIRDARGSIVALPANPLLPRAIALEAATRATLTATLMPGVAPGDTAAWSVNGASRVDLPPKPLFKVKRGGPVTLTFKNASSQLVAFRVHGFAMRILHDLDDGWEPYWRDTLLVPPGATHHAAFVADLPGRWLIESPFFDQAARGLRTWFEVS